MIIFKKIVLLSETNNSGISGVLKFENLLKETECNVHIFGKDANYELVIKFDTEIIVKKVKSLDTIKFDNSMNISGPIQILLVFDNTIVSSGSAIGKSFQIDKLYKEYIKSIKVNEEIKEQPIIAESPIIEEVEEKEQPILPEKQEDQIVTDVQEEDCTFYKKIESKLEELFKVHKKDAELETKIKGSKWARVEIGENSYYVVGIIYDEETPALICYGVPDKDALNPPQNESKCMQWFEIDETKRGYWMMYQNAIDGKTLTNEEYISRN